MDLLDVYKLTEVGLPQLCVLIKPLYLSGIWLGVNLRLDIRKKGCLA